MKILYEFYWDCGRMGSLDGLFIAEEKDIKAAIGKQIYFGEVLGKHSDIYGILNEDDLTLKSDDQEFIMRVEETIGKGTISGFNPLDYWEEE